MIRKAIIVVLALAAIAAAIAELAVYGDGDPGFVVLLVVAAVVGAGFHSASRKLIGPTDQVYRFRYLMATVASSILTALLFVCFFYLKDGHVERPGAALVTVGTLCLPVSFLVGLFFLSPDRGKSSNYLRRFVSLLIVSRDPGPPPGHCQDCGYDLTGNVSGVCPECGSKI